MNLVSSHIRQVATARGSIPQNLQQPGFLDSVSDCVFDDQIANPYPDNGRYETDSGNPYLVSKNLGLDSFPVHLNSSNIQKGVYEHADFVRDFAAAMQKTVCATKKSNLDKSGFKFVKKGLTVDYFGVSFYVQRVRLGICYGVTVIKCVPIYANCSTVNVVEGRRPARVKRSAAQPAAFSGIPDGNHGDNNIQTLSSAKND